MFNNITNIMLRYIIIRHFIDGIKPGQLYDELTDENAYEKYGIIPVKQLSKNYFYKLLKSRIPATTIEVVKIEWCNNLLEVPLANKKRRLEELTKLFYKEEDTDKKRKLLKEIREEVGEDKFLDALKESGKTKIEVSLQDEMRTFFSKAEETEEFDEDAFNKNENENN